jgi:oligopeptide transport system substrate-binding protein
MKRILSLMLVVALVLTVGTFASAESKKILNVHLLNEVESLEIGLASAGQTFDVISATEEGLYAMDAGGTPDPAIATGYTLSDDNCVYTFTLRKDALWSNGTPVTAKDFVYAWTRGIDDVTYPDYTYAWIYETACIKNASAILKHEMAPSELGVKALDDYTLQVTLASPCGYFLSLMAFPIFLPINQDFAESQGADYGKTSDNVLANGAFVLTDYTPASLSFNMVKNDKYYDKDSVKIDGIHFQVIKDNQSAMLAYENGELDTVMLTGDLTELYTDDAEFMTVPSGYYWYVSMNQKVEGLNNLNIRKAITHAIDKDALCEYVLKDGSIGAYGATPNALCGDPENGVDFRKCSGTYAQFDAALAQESWQAGLQEIGKTELTLDLLTEDTDESKAVGEYLQQQLQTNLPGLTVTLTTTVKKDRLQRMRRENGEYQLGLTRWGPDYADPMTYFNIWSTGGGHDGMSWEDSKTNGYDEMCKRCTDGDLAGKPVERWQAMIDLEAMLFDNAVTCPVYLKADALLVKSSVTGVEFHAVGTPHIYKNVDIAG